MSLPALPIPAADRRKLPGALRFYRICAWVTGTLLLLLCLEMIVKYIPWAGDFGYELYMGGNGPFLRFVVALPENGATGVNLSMLVLIVHGWFYVVYILACFRVWSLMRWPLPRLIIMLIGGVVPTLSFFVEARYTRMAYDVLNEPADDSIPERTNP